MNNTLLGLHSSSAFGILINYVYLKIENYGKVSHLIMCLSSLWTACRVGENSKTHKCRQDWLVRINHNENTEGRETFYVFLWIPYFVHVVVVNWYINWQQDTAAIGKQIKDGVRLMGRGAEQIKWPIHLEVTFNIYDFSWFSTLSYLTSCCSI